MISRFYDWLESRVDSFPDTVPTKPPSGFMGFIFHFSRPFLPLIVISALFSVAIAIVEVLMFAFLGDIVDWLSPGAHLLHGPFEGGQVRSQL